MIVTRMRIYKGEHCRREC